MSLHFFKGLPWWCRGKSICLQCGRPGFNPWVRKIPWRRKWQPTPVFLPGESHGQRSLVGYSLRVAKSRTRLSDFTSLSSLTNLEFFFKWVGSVVISFSFCLFKDLPPCPLSCLLTSYFDLLTICPVFNSFSRTYPRTFVENRCILVSAGFSVVVTKSNHKAASFFILHFFG